MPDAVARPVGTGSTERAAGVPRVLPIECRAVRVERRGRALLDDVDLEIGGDGLTVVLGPNGAGKTLLLRVLANLVPPDRGTVRWAGTAPDSSRATRLGFVFQKPVMLRRSVAANVAYALAAVGVPGDARGPRVAELLELAHLTGLAETPARLLSGGQQQRLALVRALATDPQLLFLDEPGSSLDPAAALAVEELIGSVRARGMRVVLVTHDIAQARRLADTVVFVHRGRVVEEAQAGTFFEHPRDPLARDFVAGRIIV